MNIGSKISEMRKKQNLSQEQLAEKINVARQTISKWELGETTPDVIQAKELSNIFNITLDELTKSGSNADTEEIKNDQRIKNNSNLINKICMALLILLFLGIVTFGSIIFFANYFSASASGSSIGTSCKYNNELINIEVYKDFQSGNLYLRTDNQEVNNKFKGYEYTNEEKMINDIINYLESKGAECNVFENE